VKSTSEKMVPLRHRTLAEILNPMPDAAAVITRLLTYIDRVDIASHAGAPRPPFQTPDGDPIFPEDPEDHWWLTAIQRKAPDPEEQANAGDEDGPPSELEEGEALHVSDDDPLSDDGLAVEANYEPNVAWASC
jgi:hypothetical protein